MHPHDAEKRCFSFAWRYKFFKRLDQYLAKQFNKSWDKFHQTLYKSIRVLGTSDLFDNINHWAILADYIVKPPAEANMDMLMH